MSGGRETVTLRMCDVRWASSANLALDKGLADRFFTEIFAAQTYLLLQIDLRQALWSCSSSLAEIGIYHNMPRAVLLPQPSQPPKMEYLFPRGSVGSLLPQYP